MGIKKKRESLQIVHSSSISTIQTMDDRDTVPSLPETTAKPKYPKFESYLWKQSSKQKRKWQKRWFVFMNGELQYFKDSETANNYFQDGKAELLDYQNRKEYIGNMRQCKVNKVLFEKHKYTLAITTSLKREYFLKAANLKDYNQWFSVLSLPKSNELIINETNLSENYSSVNGQDEKLWLKITQKNKFCADCNAPSPEWIAINIGVVLCFECCSVHRDLGCKVSKTRSLILDNLSVDTLKCMVNIGGNERLNKQLLEYNLSEFDKIDDAVCSLKERSDFIFNKYVKRMYVNNNKVEEHMDFDEYLFNSAVNNDCFGVIFAIFNGANINHSVKELNNKTALEAAILKGNTEVVELLRNNEAMEVLQL